MHEDTIALDIVTPLQSTEHNSMSCMKTSLHWSLSCQRKDRAHVNVMHEDITALVIVVPSSGWSFELRFQHLMHIPIEMLLHHGLDGLELRGACNVVQNARCDLMNSQLMSRCMYQEEQQSGKPLDVGAAVNGMMMQMARDNLAANFKDLATAAMKTIILSQAQAAATAAGTAGTAEALEAAQDAAAQT